MPGIIPYILDMGSARCGAPTGRNSMEQYQVTATIKGYVAAIVFVRANSAAEAIESAEMGMVERHDKLRAELVRAQSEDDYRDD